MPAIVDSIILDRLDRLDDWAIDQFLRCAGPDSPLIATGLRHLGGALASAPPGAGIRGHVDGSHLMFGLGVPASSTAAVQIEAHLDRSLASLAPWGTGLRSASFSDRGSSLGASLPTDAVERLRALRQALDPRHVFVATHEPPLSTTRNAKETR